MGDSSCIDPTLSGIRVPSSILECRMGGGIEQDSNPIAIGVVADTGINQHLARGHESRSVSCRDHRRPANLLLAIVKTMLSIEIRRFCGSNPCCLRRTLAEPTPDLVARRSRSRCDPPGTCGRCCTPSSTVEAVPRKVAPRPDDPLQVKDCVHRRTHVGFARPTTRSRIRDRGPEHGLPRI